MSFAASERGGIWSTWGNRGGASANLQPLTVGTSRRHARSAAGMGCVALIQTSSLRANHDKGIEQIETNERIQAGWNFRKGQ